MTKTKTFRPSSVGWVYIHYLSLLVVLTPLTPSKPLTLPLLGLLLALGGILLFIVFYSFNKMLVSMMKKQDYSVII